MIARSKVVIGATVDLDRRAASAFQTRSLDGLRVVYAELTGAAANQARPGVATGCDAAKSVLPVIVGFAINKLDGEGRHRAWMKDESLRLLEQYRGFIDDCGVDAGVDATSRLTADDVRGL